MKKISIRTWQGRSLSDGSTVAFEPFQTSDLTGAAYLVARGLAEYLPEVHDAKRNKIDIIADAIEQLSPGNTEQWTTDGKPSVKELEQITGFDISAAERDEAFALFDEV